MALLLAGRSPGAAAWVLGFLAVALLVASGGVPVSLLLPPARGPREARAAA